MLSSILSLLLAVTFMWDPVTNAEPPVQGYIIHYGSESGHPTQAEEMGNNTTGSVNVPPGSENYFVVTAYNTAGESGPSNEVFYAEPATVPVHGPISGTILGRTQDIVAGSSPGPDGSLDLQIRISGISGQISKIVITHPEVEGENWETPYNEAGRWIVGLVLNTDPSIVDAFLTVTTTYSTYSIEITYSDGIVVNGQATTQEPSPSPTPTPTPTPTPSPTPTPTPSPSPTATPSPTPSPTSTPTPSPTPITTDKVRWFPREKFVGRMWGGQFQGANSLSGPWTTLYTIPQGSQTLQWYEASISIAGYQYLRYLAPVNTWGGIAEIEFWIAGSKIDGQIFGTPGSWNNVGNTIEKALDGDTSTFWDAPTSGEGNHVGIDRSVAPTPTPTPSPTPSATPSPSPSPSATPSPSPSATPTPAPSGELVRYYPRSGFVGRIWGGQFQGSNNVEGPWTTFYTIPPDSNEVHWREAQVALSGYRFLRYLAPEGSYGSIAEIEFWRAGAKLTGTLFGTAGSWNNAGNTIENAIDGNTFTFWDAPTSGADNHVGIDTEIEAPTPTPTPTPPPTFRKLTLHSERFYAPGTQVPVSAPSIPPGYSFDGWIGDTQILSNFLNADTTATIPQSIDVEIEATYKEEN